MFVAIFLVFGLVLGQDSNDHKPTHNAGGKEILVAKSLHGNLQMVNGTATSLTVRLHHSSEDFSDIKWFNVHYWPLDILSLRCNENDTFKALDNVTKDGSQMLQVEISITERNKQQAWNKLEVIINLFGLYPNQSYGICIESNQLKDGNTLAWCNCTEDFRTTLEFGGVRHLFLDQETENETPHINVEWDPPAGSDDDKITYEVCIFNNGNDSTGLDSYTTTERSFSSSNCSESNNTKYDFEIHNNVTSVNVCVSVKEIGANSSKVCISSSDYYFAKQLTINATESQTNENEVDISLVNSDSKCSHCRYHVHVVCNKVPKCKTISDCNPIKAVPNGTNGSYKFAAQKMASYKILVYYVEDGIDKLVATQEYEHLPDSDNAVTVETTNTSISVSWIRPWNIIGPVSFSSQIVGLPSSSRTFKGFTGCSFTVEEENLKPFKKYNVSFNVFPGNDDPSKIYSNGRDSGALLYSRTTKPGVCNEITSISMENITFNDSKEAYPTVLFRLPLNMTGEIKNVHVSIYSKEKTHNSDHDITEKCVDRNCSIEIGDVVLPDKNYTIEMYCRNVNTTLIGLTSRTSFKTDPAIPVKGKDILNISKQKWNRKNNSSDIEVTISSNMLDNAAGTIKHALICYDKKEILERLLPRLTNGYLKDSQVPNCTRNVSLELLDTAKLKNLDFNEDYAAILYYKNELAFTFSNILHFRTRENPTHSIVAVSMIILMFIILFILSMYFSRLEKSITSTLNLPDLEFYPSSLEGESFHHSISKVNWKEELQELLREPKIAIKKEFFSLSQKNIHGSHPPSTCIAENENNLNKNRYFDIVPYDFSRVVLQALPGKDQENYINASYIHGYNVNCGFIACQGPKESTAHDFWRMIVEKNVRVIVMLTRCVEGREKCCKYWPSVTPLITASNTSIKPLQETADPSGDYTIRKFLVSQGWETQEVVQFHFTAWPDKKCPTTANFHSFISEVKSYGLSESSPVVVHCSAGVGRTGSFIALYNLLDEIQDDTKDFIDIYYQVLKMRCFRSYMVQTQSQYIFLYESIHQLFQDNSGELPRNESVDRMSDEELEELSEDESGIA